MPKLPEQKPALEFNEDFQNAYDLMLAGPQCLFITGRAGTGKSTLLKHFVQNSGRSCIVLAPTGVAALNAGGQTIHSFFKIYQTITVEEPGSLPSDKKTVVRKADLIIIDEVSMVRADLLDIVDQKLQRGLSNQKPFGGKRIVFFGDLYQLPPVVTSKEKDYIKASYLTEYFFSASCLSGADLKIIELEKIYRQKDDSFISLLNAVRNNTVNDAQIEILNSRCLPDYVPGKKELTVHLVSVNEKADTINQEKLERLKGKTLKLPALIDGIPESWQFPTEKDLKVKIGAQVMMVNNDADGLWVNGTLGTVSGFTKEDGQDIVEVELESGISVDVIPYEWDVYDYHYDSTENRIFAQKAGSFIQYPFKLAWAITIHKSQGKTYSKAVIDFGKRLFCAGQAYVALSRCVSLEGMVLTRKIRRSDIFTDRRIAAFMTAHYLTDPEKTKSEEQKIGMLRDCVEQKKSVSILYLKNGDQKSRRIVKPETVGEMDYMGKSFLGLKAFCMERQESRTFRIDRILEIESVESETE